MINDKLHFDDYHKLRNFYFHYEGCHPPHRKSNIVLSLARPIF